MIWHPMYHQEFLALRASLFAHLALKVLSRDVERASQAPHRGWFELGYVGLSLRVGGWFELVGNGMINGFNHVEPTGGAPPEKGSKK